MSHYFGIVLIHEGDGQDAVDKLMAPHSENNDPDNGWWDWYRLGGRWDGKVRGHVRDCPLCETDWHHHYDAAHETWERNAIPVREMGEVRPFTVVTPDGRAFHTEIWDGNNNFIVIDPNWDETCGRLLVEHRGCVAVGIDYHS